MGGPKAGGPEGWGAKISRFFFPLPPLFSFFPPSLGGPLYASGPLGLHTTTRELQKCTFQGPGLQKHHQNSTKGPPREGEGKKKRNFGGSSGGWSSGGGVERKVYGLGFGVEGLGFKAKGQKQKQNNKEINSKMSKKKNKKKTKKKKEKKKEKKRRKSRKRSHRANTICATSANFDFGQFRLRPIRFRPAGRSRIGRSRTSSAGRDG